MSFKMPWLIHNRYMDFWGGGGGSGPELICMWDLKGKNSPRLHIFTYIGYYIVLGFLKNIEMFFNIS